MSQLWTGASLIYDRHTMYKTMHDYRLASKVQHILNQHANIRCKIDVAVFNQDILLAGYLPNEAMLQTFVTKISQLPYRSLFNYLSISDKCPNSLQDSWITTKIKAYIIADAEINPKQFKIITVDNKIFIMGDVEAKQAKKVLNIVRHLQRSYQMVNLMKYYELRAVG